MTMLKQIKWDGLFSAKHFHSWRRIITDTNGITSSIVSGNHHNIIHPAAFFLFWLLLCAASLHASEIIYPPKYWNIAIYSISDDGMQSLYEVIDFSKEEYLLYQQAYGDLGPQIGMSRKIREYTGSIELAPLLCWLENKAQRHELADELRGTAELENRCTRIFFWVLIILSLPSTLLWAFIIFKTLGSRKLSFVRTLDSYMYFSAFWMSIGVPLIWIISISGINDPSPESESYFRFYLPQLFNLSGQLAYSLHFAYYFNVTHGAGLLKTGAVAALSFVFCAFILILVASLVRYFLELSPLF